MSSAGSNNVSLRKESIGCENLWLADDNLNGEWTTFTPLIAGGAQRDDASTVTVGRYKKIGKTVHVTYELSHSGGAGSATGTLVVGLPITPRAHSAGNRPVRSLGSAYVTSTTATGYHGIAIVDYQSQTLSFRIINRGTPSVDQILDHNAVPRLSEAAFSLVASVTYEIA